MTKRKRLKDRQYNDQKKKTKGQTNDPQHTYTTQEATNPSWALEFTPPPPPPPPFLVGFVLLSKCICFSE